MPGAGFQKVAERYRRTNLDQSYRPLEFVKRRLVSQRFPKFIRSLSLGQLEKDAVPSFVSALLQSDLSSLDSETLPFAAASLFGGGTDTVRIS